MGIHTNLSYCTAQLPDGESCGKPSEPDMPFPICGPHASRVYRAVARLAGGLTDDPLYRVYDGIKWMHQSREEESRQHEDRLARRVHPAEASRIYYLQLGEYIKIGYASDLRTRLASYPPMRRLLATEPADMDCTEADRLRQFADHLAYGNEWFHPGADLIEHINVLRRRAGSPAIRSFI